MLSLDSLKAFAVQWQTNVANVAREYVQHVFLAHFYQHSDSDHLAFKGGTALRLLYGSPRFSEDLDFTGVLKPFHMRRLLEGTADRVIKEIPSFQTLESKPTSGGYLALYAYELYQESLRLELNVSFRTKAVAEPVLVTTPLVPAYQCLRLPTKDLVGEKIQALLARKKSRDFYDLYFLLRQRLGIDAIVPLKARLLKEVEGLESKAIGRELKVFLPVSHHKTIANLPRVLSEELRRL